MTQRQTAIPTGPRLGRGLINHDERSKNYRATDLIDSTSLVTKKWRRGNAYDQGQTPECVAYTGKGLLNTQPDSSQVPYRVRSKYSCDDFYHGAQANDETPGTNYDGTSALGLCRYLTSINIISEYRWCFGLQDVLLTLSNLGPVGIGVRWLDGMWNTDAEGYLHVTGNEVGGHEVELLGINVEQEYVLGENSWGTSWGLNGRFKLSFANLDTLLKDQGDAFTITKLAA